MGTRLAREFERLAQEDPTTLSDVIRAHRFYYLIMAGWGGELDYPRFQTSISDGGHGNRLIGALKRLRERLEPIHTRLRTVIIENLSWEQCIDRYDREKTFMYIDPPYPQNGCNYKHNMQDWAEHRQLAVRLANTKYKWILSSYDWPEVREMYDGYDITSIQSYSGMRTEKKRFRTRVESGSTYREFQHTDKRSAPSYRRTNGLTKIPAQNR